MSVNPLIQPSIGSAPPLGLVPSNPTAANDNAAIARDAVSNGTVDQVGRAAAKNQEKHPAAGRYGATHQH